ncbi:MAG: transglutaminase domain-containing protein [Planctomycetes bacterium]|nr:transglutaminase domain-containing protein [Planctomycetota bacterium]
MNLYRTLRISLYLLVATGAYAVWSVEGNPAYLLGVLVAGIAAHFSVDAGRCRPVRSGLAGLFCLLLLLNALIPALEAIKADQNRVAVESMTHFLCLVQIALFFTAFRGSVITFCSANLFIVVVSGILDSGPGLLFRLLVFLMACTWTLFLAALWRERSRFEGQSAVVSTRRPSLDSESPRADLSERTVRQGLVLTLMLSTGCIVFGFLLFFTWPRINVLGSVADWFRPVHGAPSGGPGNGGIGPGLVRDGFEEQFTAFNEEGVGLDEVGGLIEDDAPAMNVIFTPIPSAWAPESNRIYLRGLAYVRYAKNRWDVPDAKRDVVRTAEEGDRIFFREKSDLRLGGASFLEPAGHEKEIHFRVRHIRHRGTVYFTVGAPRRILPAPAFQRAVAVDETGGLHTPHREELRYGDPAYHYEVWCNYPVDASRLPESARIAYIDQQYTDWRESVGRKYEQRLENLARQIVQSARNDKEKAERLRDYFLASKRFTYSLRTPGGGVGAFLFDEPGARHGPCGYFASAFVLLCRAAGLPARLAVGYAHTETNEETAQGSVTFRNSDAHAWGEVYFDRYGWVAFDPTPASTEPLGTQPETAIDGGPNPGPKALHVPRPDEPQFNSEGKVEACWQFFTNYSQQDQEHMYGAVSKKLEQAVQHAEAWFSGSGRWGVGGAVFLWLVLGVALVVSAVAFFRNQEKRKGPQASLPPRARAAVNFYNDLLLVLGKRGYVRRAGQTPREFAEAVVRRGGESLAPVMLVTSIFERVRYGEEDIDAHDLESVGRAFKALQDAVPGFPPAAETASPA